MLKLVRNRKILNSHLFCLNSHPSRACLVLRACKSLATTRRKGVNLTKKSVN